MGWKNRFATISVALASLFSAPAWGSLATYDMVLAIDSVQLFSPCESAPSRFGCLGAGETFRGRFSVDSSILATDGIHSSAAIYDFHLAFGDAVYATGPSNTALGGFRNPHLGAAAPSFRILGGHVVDLIGGVYGSSDIPFIDMSGYAGVADNRFSAYDGVTRALGSLTITTAVPEPETYALWMLGFGAVLLAVRGQKK